MLSCRAGQDARHDVGDRNSVGETDLAVRRHRKCQHDGRCHDSRRSRSHFAFVPSRRTGCRSARAGRGNTNRVPVARPSQPPRIGRPPDRTRPGCGWRNAARNAPINGVAPLSHAVASWRRRTASASSRTRGDNRRRHGRAARHLGTAGPQDRRRWRSIRSRTSPPRRALVVRDIPAVAGWANRGRSRHSTRLPGATRIPRGIRRSVDVNQA